MITLTNSEGKVLTYTNAFIEAILLQLNSSNNYYTTGDDDNIFVIIGSTKALLLDYTYHINRTIFQNYTINENLINLLTDDSCSGSPREAAGKNYYVKTVYTNKELQKKR